MPNPIAFRLVMNNHADPHIGKQTSSTEARSTIVAGFSRFADALWGKTTSERRALARRVILLRRRRPRNYSWMGA